MRDTGKDKMRPSRRGFLTTAGLAAAGIGGTGAVSGAVADARAATMYAPASQAGPSPAEPAADAAEILPFWGKHQGGIVTAPQQTHSYFAAFDLATTKRDELVGMLRTWTIAAARMAAGKTAEPLSPDTGAPGADTGDTLGMAPCRLTITFGFGAGLFTKDGKDRYGLAARRPEALVDLPRFNGEQLVESATGGDLSVQACADDPQVAFHAVRQLARLAYGAAEIRWAQSGFMAGFPAKDTARNLMGFKDGTNNPAVGDPALMDKFVWGGAEAPDWMQGGSYLVARRIRIALEHWDRMKVAFQEQTFGRHKYSGAPLGGKHENDPLDLAATDSSGNPVIPESAHVRLAAPANYGGAQILRRGYSYNDGLNFTAERWPPWRQGMEYDAGLFFTCYQRDPRQGFIRIFDKMSKFDMINQFATHVGSGIFACPAGAAEGEFIGQRLFAAA